MTFQHTLMHVHTQTISLNYSYVKPPASGHLLEDQGSNVRTPYFKEKPTASPAQMILCTASRQAFKAVLWRKSFSGVGILVLAFSVFLVANGFEQIYLSGSCTATLGNRTKIQRSPEMKTRSTVSVHYSDVI